MILCHKAKFDQKSRLRIPREYIKLAGGEDDCKCYITFDENTKEIKIIMEKVRNNADENVNMKRGAE